MAATQKYKVNNMAKDLDKKTKEIVELLKDKGFDGKSSSSVMENAEINIVLNHYISKSEVSDIAAYLATPKPTEKAEAAPLQRQKLQKNRQKRRLQRLSRKQNRRQSRSKRQKSRLKQSRK